ncbi:hypothetical protein HY496_03105 [Candidatus Woesearchaeota archaeon]|nr:hypothetical protein [Candidatus Woesearchaeota archaeon]
MDKKEFARQMLKFLTEFQAADEATRKKLGKAIATFFLKNEKLDSKLIALNDKDLQYVGFAMELDEYKKETFSEDDLAVAISVLRKVVKGKS